MTLVVNTGSPSFTSVTPRPAAYSRMNVRIGSFTSTTEFYDLTDSSTIIFCIVLGVSSLVKQFSPHAMFRRVSMRMSFS